MMRVPALASIAATVEPVVSLAARIVRGITETREAWRRHGAAFALLGLRSPSLSALGCYRTGATIEPTWYPPRPPRWYAPAWPLPCSRPGCGSTVCRHARPAHVDRAERKRARRAAR